MNFNPGKSLLISNNLKIVVFVFFAAFLIIGLSIYKDYGMSWDEDNSRYDTGYYNVNIITGTPQGEQNFRNIYHGPAFELLLIAIEKLQVTFWQQTDSRDIYFTRHLVTFLLFYLSVIFFYLICRERFNNHIIALIGCLFLILSPRIFADAFYNPKDIPLLSLFIISIYTLIKFNEQKSYSWAAIHALTCAVLIDIRIIGIIVPILSFFLIGIDLLLSYFFEMKSKINIRILLIYVILLICFTILFFPVSWERPIHHFIEGFKVTSQYPVSGPLLYLGNIVDAAELPWHYIPVWITITTPVLYLLLFIFGTLMLLISFYREPLKFLSNEKVDIVSFICFFIPLIAVIVLKSAQFDAWRHMFFIYPAFLLISINGMVKIFNIINNRFKGITYKIARFGFILLILFSLIGTMINMVKYHPYQNVYFNSLAGNNMEEIKNKFELDYWGLSYRKGLEYILENDKSQTITLKVANYPGILNSQILTYDERSRIKYTENLDEADYFLSNYRWHKEEYPYKNEFFSIKIEGAKIMVVYKMK